MHNVNWEITQQSKVMGGIGIGNLCHHNLALLAEWIRHFLHEKDVLWCELIVARYYSIIPPFKYG